jgi:putative multiple sugar transport system ATP-binding protein
MSVFGRSYGKYVSGRVVKDGREIRTRTVPEAVDHGIVYVTEDRKHYGLNLMDDIARSITLASLPKVSNRTVINEHNETMVAERYRRDMRIKAPSVRATTGNLSGGNQQKVVLSKWIFADPDVLILDEPTRGIDVGAKYEIYQIINSLAAQGKAVIVISSELPELIGLCDRIYTLNEGRLTGEVPREQATQETLMRYMMKGHTA